MQIRNSPAIVTVPENAHHWPLCWAKALVVVVPGAVVVRLIVAEPPGAAVAELQVTPSGRVPPQLSAICELKPRMLCVLTVSDAVSPAVKVNGFGVAVSVNPGVVTRIGVVPAEVTLFQFASPE